MDLPFAVVAPRHSALELFLNVSAGLRKRATKVLVGLPAFLGICFACNAGNDVSHGVSHAKLWSVLACVVSSFSTLCAASLTLIMVAVII